MAQPPSDFDHRPPPGTSAANAPRPHGGRHGGQHGAQHGGRQGLREATLPWPGAEPLPAPFPWLGGFLHGRPYLAERLATLATLIAAERGPGRLLPWLAIAFGAGIAVYFTATHEPVWWVAALTALVLCGIAYRVRAHARVFAATALGAAMLCGFAIASIKAVMHDTVPPTINHFTDDPELEPGLNFTFNKAQQRTVRAALSNTFGFGGHNACVIVKKYPG